MTAEYIVNRPDLSDLTSAQLAPLEALIAPNWPAAWPEFARSLYTTLLALPGQHAAPDELARMAIALLLGLAQDLGGTQPYIGIGQAMQSSARARRVIELLDRGVPYKRVAAETGLTEPRVRAIEAEWRRAQMEARQGKLPLE
ncbi:MAG TPA: hypothetical protein PKD73_06140 [Burkholderiaceae bacterium]|nr:hypothetical protein [Burkholderiaceae bacterium]